MGAAVSQGGDLLKALGADVVENLPDAFAGTSTQSVIDALRALDIGVHRVEPPGRLLADDGVAAKVGLRVEDYSETNGRVLMVGPVARLSRTPSVAGALARSFGGNSEEIRREMGFGAASSP